MISTYFVRSSDDSQTSQRRRSYNSDHNSPSRSKNSVRFDAVGSTGLIPSNDFYYDDTGLEVIKIEQEKVTPRPQSLRDFKAVIPAAYDGAEGEIEIELKDADVKDNSENKAGILQMDTVTKSSILNWRKERTPKAYEPPALEFMPQSKKKQTPNADYASQRPGNGYYIIIYLFITLSVCLHIVFHVHQWLNRVWQRHPKWMPMDCWIKHLLPLSMLCRVYMQWCMDAPDSVYIVVVCLQMKPLSFLCVTLSMVEIMTLVTKWHFIKWLHT